MSGLNKHPPLGLYRIFWKSGGSSLAAIGMLPNGGRWVAPTNWVHPTEKQDVWDDIEKLEAIPLTAILKAFNEDAAAEAD